MSMRRIAQGTAVIAALTLLSGATAQAQTTTTTTTATTTTTTTTLLPHPFSPATKACVNTAKQAYKACGNTTDCRKAYETAYAKCFAAPAGQKCASGCLTKEDTCLANVPKTKKTCRKNCRTTRKNDVASCKLIAQGDTIWASGDSGCLGTAYSNYTLCTTFVCGQAKADCQTNFTFCIADCQNL
jgi:hypothetical protein